MRLLSFGENGSSVGVVCHDRTVADVSGLIPKGWDRSRGLMRVLISNFEGLRDGIEKLASEGNGVSLDSLTLTAPITDPSKIVAAPVNYLDHMTEMNQASHIDSLGVFLKAPSSLVGHSGTVKLPYSDRRFDQEGELCFVIGSQARNVKASGAFDYIFGFSILLDITMRGGEDRSTRKSFDTFTPMGPWIVTTDEISSLEDLRNVLPTLLASSISMQMGQQPKAVPLALFLFAPKAAASLPLRQLDRTHLPDPVSASHLEP